MPIVADEPARFPVVVLGEGGQSTWTDERAARFARGGGRRVLFVCSTAAYEGATPPALAILKRAGIEAKMITAGHIGHVVDDRVVTGKWIGGTGPRRGSRPDSDFLMLLGGLAGALAALLASFWRMKTRLTPAWQAR